MERAEAGFILEKGPTGHGGATGEKNLDRRIKPDYRNTRIAEKLRGTLLSIGATTKSEDRGFATLDGAAECSAKLVGFELTEGEFAMAFKELWNGDAGSFLYLFVQVDKTPSQLLGKARADGAFAGAHETGERDDGNARGSTAKNRRLSHDSWWRGLIALQNSDCTIVGGEFHFCETHANGSEEACGKLPLVVAAGVNVRLDEVGGLIVDGAKDGLGP